MGNKRKNNILLLIIFLLIIIILLMSLQKYNLPPEITNIIYKEKYNEDKTKDVTLEIKRYNFNTIYCKFETDKESSDWIKVINNKCTSKVKTDKYNITLKYNGNLTAKYEKEFDIDGVISFDANLKVKYLAVGNTSKIDTKLDYVGEKYSKVTFTTSDNKLASINEDGVVTALGDGTVKLVAAVGDFKKEFSLITTSLLRKPEVNNNKEIIPCKGYTKEQINTLDTILDMKIKDAGVKTRAAAVEASRYLTLELPYKVPYFYENGRLSFTYQVDGEGRYYHKGLYLGEDKEKEITLNSTGPASWGCPLQDSESRLWGRNGLDCSGFVTWVLVQAGLDLGDIGAGITSSRDYTDVGEFNRITYSYMTSGKVKPGDLIGWDGHIAIIAAMDENDIYVAESLQNGVIVEGYNYSNSYSRFYSRYQHIIDMSSNYVSDGNLKKMW